MLVDLVADLLHHRHAEADQPRGAGPHPLLPGREADSRAAAPTRWPTSPRSAAGRCPSASSATTPRPRAARRPRRRAAIETAGILVRPGYRTPTKVRILGGGKHSIKQQIVRYDIEETLDADRRGARPLLAAPAASAGPARRGWRSSPTTATAPSSRRCSRRLRARARRRTATLLCDSRYRLGDFAGLDGATPNEEEAEALARRAARRRSGRAWRTAAGGCASGWARASSWSPAAAAA